jgi:rSAM/selenodomain-associated transferase 1
VSVNGRPGRGERVLVVAKAPAPGATKTRLVPPLDPVEAAALGRAMLLDTLDSCRAEASDVGVLYARSEEGPELRELAGRDALLVRQEGDGLTDALVSGARIGLGDRDAVALVSSDIPGTPPGALGRAFAALADGADVVLGPGVDGGYWLVALREPHAGPFQDIPWSTDGVLAVTLDRCAAAGLRVALVDSWRDVDTPEDLAALRPELGSLPGRRTAEAIADLEEVHLP